MICQNNGARALLLDGRKTDMRKMRLKRERGKDGRDVRESGGCVSYKAVVGVRLERAPKCGTARKTLGQPWVSLWDLASGGASWADLVPIKSRPSNDTFASNPGTRQNGPWSQSGPQLNGPK
jgi:hypothetical protein